MATSSNMEEYIPDPKIRRVIEPGRYEHTFYFEFVLTDLANRKRWKFHEFLETHCRDTKTSWLCTIKFRKIYEDGKAVVPYRLKRLDSQDVPMRARFQMKVLDDLRRSFFDCAESPPAERPFRPKEVAKGCHAEFIENPGLVTCFNQKLYVSITIDIVGCHNRYSLSVSRESARVIV